MSTPQLCTHLNEHRNENPKYCKIHNDEHCHHCLRKELSTNNAYYYKTTKLRDTVKRVNACTHEVKRRLCLLGNRTEWELLSVSGFVPASIMSKVQEVMWRLTSICSVQTSEPLVSFVYQTLKTCFDLPCVGHFIQTCCVGTIVFFSRSIHSFEIFKVADNSLSDFQSCA